MIEKLYYLLSIFAVAILVVGCPFMGMVYEEDLVNRYAVWATDVMEQAKIVKKDKEISSTTIYTLVVPATVFAYGWNDDFILAKRHPPKKDKKVDTNLTYWYIIEVASGDRDRRDAPYFLISLRRPLKDFDFLLFNFAF